MNDPLAVLQRIRDRARAARSPGPGSAASCVAEPIADEHGHLVDLEARNLMCACRGCYLLFTSSGAGRRPLPGGPRSVPRLPDFRLSPEPVGQPADPGERGVLLRELRARPGRRLLSGSGGRDRVAAPARDLGGGGRRQPRAGARWSPTSRPSSSAPERDGGGAECFIVPIDACYELVGHLRLAVARLRRRPRGPRRSRRVLRPDPIEGRRGDGE